MKLSGIFLVPAAYFCAVSPLGAQTEPPPAPRPPLYSPGYIQAEKIKDKGEEIRIPVNWEPSLEDRQKAHLAWQTICENLKDCPQEDKTLLVAYVTFADKPALDNYRERYDRILKNIQGFFADQMKANGFPPLTFPLELDANDRLVLHEAHVPTPLKNLSLEKIYAQAQDAIEKVLKQKNIDTQKKHLLIIVPECKEPSFMRALKLSEFGYPFDSRNSVCFVEDRKGVDPRQLFSKAPYDKKDQKSDYYKKTIGENTSFIMGAAAHELGHLFTLLHTMENEEYASAGKSLMGYGNHTYADALTKSGPGTFLEPTNALILASHPLFNGRKTEKLSTKFTIEEITFIPIRGGSLFSGNAKVTGKYPGYAVTVHLDPLENDDYDSTAASSLIGNNDKIQLKLTRPGYTGYVHLKLLAHLTNNEKIPFFLHAWMTPEGLHVPDLQENALYDNPCKSWADRNLPEARIKFSRMVKQSALFPGKEKYIRFWEKAMTYDQPRWISTAAGIPPDQKRASLVDCRPASVMSGFGIPCWDTLYPSELGAIPYAYNGTPDRFIFVHANGLLDYDLAGKWKQLKFTGSVPLGRAGSVQFEVTGNGKKLFTSKILKEGESQDIDISVKKVKNLQINIKDGGDGNTADWAILGNPELLR